MTSLNFEFLKNPLYKGYEICDNEDFLFIKKNGIPVDVYSSKSPDLTQSFLEKRVKEMVRQNGN